MLSNLNDTSIYFTINLHDKNNIEYHSYNFVYNTPKVWFNRSYDKSIHC